MDLDNKLLEMLSQYAMETVKADRKLYQRFRSGGSDLDDVVNTAIARLATTILVAIGKSNTADRTLFRAVREAIRSETSFGVNLVLPRSQRIAMKLQAIRDAAFPHRDSSGAAEPQKGVIVSVLVCRGSRNPQWAVYATEPIVQFDRNDMPWDWSLVHGVGGWSETAIRPNFDGSLQPNYAAVDCIWPEYTDDNLLSMAEGLLENITDQAAEDGFQNEEGDDA